MQTEKIQKKTETMEANTRKKRNTTELATKETITQS